MKLTERAGLLGGAVLGPLAAVGAVLRGARFFHPRGVVYRARVEPLVGAGPRGRLARRLEGPALARFSGAWWRAREWPDVLGLALRFGADQDLLFATIRRPVTTLLAPLTTAQHDFLGNDYYAVSPFKVDELGHVRFRAVPVRAPQQGDTREERLQSAVEGGRAEVTLEVQLEPERAYLPFARVVLEERLDLDQRGLAFDPFRDGRGIRPEGFVHGLRRLTYALARRGRDAPVNA